MQLIQFLKLWPSYIYTHNDLNHVQAEEYVKYLYKQWIICGLSI